MEKLRTLLTAGKAQAYHLAGRYIEVLNASFPFTIELYDPNGSLVESITDAEEGDQLVAGFVRMSIRSDTTQTVRLFVSDNAGGSRRISGVTRVADARMQEAVDGAAYWFARQSQGGAASVPVVAIVNQSALNSVRVSGVRLRSSVVQDVRVSLGVSATPGGAVLSGVGFMGKAFNVPPATLLCWSEAGATIAAPNVVVRDIQTERFPLDAPLILPPGTVLTFEGVTVNTALSVSADLELFQ